MRTAICLGLALLFACDGGEQSNDDSTRPDSGTNDDSGTASDSGTPNDSGTNPDSGTNAMDSGTDTDSGVAEMDSGTADTGVMPIECDPSFGAAGACGGELGGLWNYRAACGRTPISTSLEEQCPAVVIQADRFEGGSGTLDVEGAQFDLAVNVDVHVEATLPAQCALGDCATTQVVLQQAFSDTSVTCTGVAACDCTIDGSVAYRANGVVTTAGGVATVDGSEQYYYCAQGESLIYRRFDDEAVFVLDR